LPKAEPAASLSPETTHVLEDLNRLFREAPADVLAKL
jgi:hypothetical protein